MTWRAIFILILALAPAALAAQEVSGPARVVDGDTLDLTGLAVRLLGIDAPEHAQTCRRANQNWACGKDAAAKLATLTAGKTVRCEQQSTDSYGRIVARCFVDGRDLGQDLVDAGLAVALPDFSDRYIAAEARARTGHVGIWDSEFERPSDYRVHHPDKPSRHRQASERVTTAPAYRINPVFYRNCSEARAAGAAPIYRGQPGYRSEMDGDGDGIACEPYNGRR